MAKIVKERRNDRVVLALFRKRRGDERESIEEPRHHERRPNRMRKAAMFRAWEDKAREAELTHAPKPLHLARREERGDQRLSAALKSDEAMYRIAEDHQIKARAAAGVSSP